jgi:hypothetical protein
LYEGSHDKHVVEVHFVYVYSKSKSYRASHYILFVTFQDERSLIDLHLMHTSYFLFVMAVTLVCYALIKGKPKQKAILIDKV